MDLVLEAKYNRLKKMYQENEFTDLASFKPLYLKDFVPTTSKS